MAYADQEMSNTKLVSIVIVVIMANHVPGDVRKPRQKLLADLAGGAVGLIQLHGLLATAMLALETGNR